MLIKHNCFVPFLVQLLEVKLLINAWQLPFSLGNLTGFLALDQKEFESHTLYRTQSSPPCPLPSVTTLAVLLRVYLSSPFSSLILRLHSGHLFSTAGRRVLSLDSSYQPWWGRISPLLYPSQSAAYQQAKAGPGSHLMASS